MKVIRSNLKLLSLSLNQIVLFYRMKDVALTVGNSNGGKSPTSFTFTWNGSPNQVKLAYILLLCFMV